MNESLVGNFTKILPKGSCCGNNLGNSEYDQFWQTKEKTMQFILTKQIVVEAETPEEAATKEGKTISLNVAVRPTPATTTPSHLAQRQIPVPIQHR